MKTNMLDFAAILKPQVSLQSGFTSQNKNAGKTNNENSFSKCLDEKRTAPKEKPENSREAKQYHKTDDTNKTHNKDDVKNAEKPKKVNENREDGQAVDPELITNFKTIQEQVMIPRLEGENSLIDFNLNDDQLFMTDFMGNKTFNKIYQDLNNPMGGQSELMNQSLTGAGGQEALLNLQNNFGQHLAEATGEAAQNTANTGTVNMTNAEAIMNNQNQVGLNNLMQGAQHVEKIVVKNEPFNMGNHLKLDDTANLDPKFAQLMNVGMDKQVNSLELGHQLAANQNGGKGGAEFGEILKNLDNSSEDMEIDKMAGEFSQEVKTLNADPNQVQDSRPDESITLKPVELAKEVFKVVQDFASKKADNSKTIEISLDPPQLGKISVSLKMEEGGAVRSQFTCSPETAGVIKEHLVELKTALNNHGLSLGESFVNHHQDQSQNSQNHQNSNNNNRQWKPDNSIESINNSAGITEVSSEDGSTYTFII
ncbi:MAG: flagellar hook-length control protein FliK [Vulcanimicrobiota bacterium]